MQTLKAKNLNILPNRFIQNLKCFFKACEEKELPINGNNNTNDANRQYITAIFSIPAALISLYLLSISYYQ